MLNVLDFASHMASVTTIQLCSCSAKAASGQYMDNKNMSVPMFQ